MLSQAEEDALGSLDIKEYQRRVIALFKDGNATRTQWEEMAYAVQAMSEYVDAHEVEGIDRAVLAMSNESLPLPDVPFTLDASEY